MHLHVIKNFKFIIYSILFRTKLTLKYILFIIIMISMGVDEREKRRHEAVGAMDVRWRRGRYRGKSK